MYKIVLFVFDFKLFVVFLHKKVYDLYYYMFEKTKDFK